MASPDLVPDDALARPPRSALASSVDLPVLAGLDGLRALAVSLVMVDHYGTGPVPGGYGVILFFVLSGFLITRLLLREQHRSGRISLRRFYARRALRIFPAFYVYWLGIVAALIVTGRHVPWAHAWSAFAYVSNYFNAINGDPNTAFSHTWSLAAEEQFYLLWPLTLIFLLRRKRPVLDAVLLGIVAIWVLRFILVFGFQVPQRYMYASFETRADALLVGCALALLVDRESTANRLQGVSSHWGTALLVLAGVVALAVAGELVGTSAFRDTIVFLVVPLLFAVVVLHVVAAPAGVLTRLLSLAPIAYMGRISYGMYLYQQVVTSPVRHGTTGLPLPIQILVLFGVTVGLATASYYVIERPFLILKERFSGPGAGPPFSSPIAPRESEVSGPTSSALTDVELGAR